MRRRSFFQSLAYTGAITAFAGLPFFVARVLAPVAPAGASTHLPLPGALADPAAFNAACIGCGVCGEVCPPRCIKFFHHEGGHKANTPYINPEEKGCILCGKCMEACPTNALQVTPIRDVAMGIAQIDRSACYPWVDRGVCGACVTVCPLGESAIGFDFANIYRPVVASGCVGCGLCVEVCPEPSLPIRIVDRSLGTVTRHKTV